MIHDTKKHLFGIYWNCVSAPGGKLPQWSNGIWQRNKLKTLSRKRWSLIISSSSAYPIYALYNAMTAYVSCLNFRPLVITLVWWVAFFIIFWKFCGYFVPATWSAGADFLVLFHIVEAHLLLKPVTTTFSGMEAAVDLTPALCNGCITIWHSPSLQHQ
jgi:hypothetical protein